MKKLIVLFVILLLVSTTACNLLGNDDKEISNGNSIKDTTPPIISGIQVSDITATTATISWSTDEPATGNVEYGLTNSYGFISHATADTTADTTSHSAALSGLNSNITYYYKIKAEDAEGNEAVNGDKTFKTSAVPTGDLSVHFIDVGQGDAILIDYGTTEILIDGGDASHGVTGYLSNYVDGDLEVMVATHMHADHIGGLTAVLNTFQVDEIWYNGDTSTSKTYTNFMTAVNAEGAQVQVARRGDQISVGGLTLDVLNLVNTSGTSNNNSIVLSLSYGDTDFLFTGDAEQEAEASMLAAGVVPDVDILKVGHHGSNTASSAAFLAATTPEVAIYMAGTGNTYGHPHAETITALNNIGATIYGTDVHGTIIVTTDGVTYDVQPTNAVSSVTP